MVNAALPASRAMPLNGEPYGHPDTAFLKLTVIGRQTNQMRGVHIAITGITSSLGPAIDPLKAPTFGLAAVWGSSVFVFISTTSRRSTPIK